MEPQLMPEWEDNLRSSFGNRRIDIERTTKQGPRIDETKAVKDAKTLLWQAEKTARENARISDKQKEEK